MCSASPSRWPTSDRSATCGGKNGCIERLTSKGARTPPTLVIPSEARDPMPAGAAPAFSGSFHLCHRASRSRYNRPMPEPASLRSKRQRLEEILRASGRVLVAYSGGVDSAYLAWVAHQQLG